jgi:hypothetical protein
MPWGFGWRRAAPGDGGGGNGGGSCLCWPHLLVTQLAKRKCGAAAYTVALASLAQRILPPPSCNCTTTLAAAGRAAVHAAAGGCGTAGGRVWLHRGEGLPGLHPAPGLQELQCCAQQARWGWLVPTLWCLRSWCWPARCRQQQASAGGMAPLWQAPGLRGAARGLKAGWGLCSNSNNAVDEPARARVVAVLRCAVLCFAVRRFAGKAVAHPITPLLLLPAAAKLVLAEVLAAERAHAGAARQQAAAVAMGPLAVQADKGND